MDASKQFSSNNPVFVQLSRVIDAVKVLANIIEKMILNSGSVESTGLIADNKNKKFNWRTFDTIHLLMNHRHYSKQFAYILFLLIRLNFPLIY